VICTPASSCGVPPVAVKAPESVPVPLALAKAPLPPVTISAARTRAYRPSRPHWIVPAVNWPKTSPRAVSNDQVPPVMRWVTPQPRLGGV
jgi:hypothetical protein